MLYHPMDQCEQASRAAFNDPAISRRAADVAIYLAHVEKGVSMRSLAAARGAAPSTILRAVRRVEKMRDDPLLDRTLAELEADLGAPLPDRVPAEESAVTRKNSKADMTKGDKALLRRLCEPEAFLLVAQSAEKAGVFCRTNQFRRPLAMVPVDKAITYLKRDWIKCVSRTEISARYEATTAGRAALRRALAAEAPEGDSGYAGAPSVFSDQHQSRGERRVVNMTTGEVETIRVNLGESPLGWLSRRKDANGNPLLAMEEVEAGERLREDFELAQIGPSVAQDWRKFLTPSTSSGGGRTPSEGPMFARERVAAAMEALGPGLSDAALRVCCFHEGLEATERRMGWSARSGKVVLKLALQRLVDHYELPRSQSHQAQAS